MYLFIVLYLYTIFTTNILYKQYIIFLYFYNSLFITILNFISWNTTFMLNLNYPLSAIFRFGRKYPYKIIRIFAPNSVISTIPVDYLWVRLKSQCSISTTTTYSNFLLLFKSAQTLICSISQSDFLQALYFYCSFWLFKLLTAYSTI